MQRLEGKIAIVTGAARGMGEATARLFAEHGATVILADRLEELGSKLAAEIGGSARFEALDVADEAGWATFAARALRDFGRIDVLINNAGINWLSPLHDTSKADFEKVLGVNLVGPFLGMRAVAPSMKERRSGAIINISSIEGLRGTSGMAAYNASKWGLRGMSKAVALELAPYGVRVNSVHPGAIDTPMLDPDGEMNPEKLAREFNIPMGRIAQPVEVAQASLFLASDDASYVNGAELAVDGAWTSGLMLKAYNTKPKGSF